MTPECGPRPQQTSRRVFGDGSTSDLPPFLDRLLRPGDDLAFLASGNTHILIKRPSPCGRPIQLLYATIGNVSQPKASEKGAGFFVRAEIANCSASPRAVFLSGDAIRRYFYLLDDENQQTLYGLLEALESASPADLRLAWRVRNLELGLTPVDATERSKLERAFNILAHTDLRNCYDALRRDEDAPPLFPYGGFGSILVEG